MNNSQYILISAAIFGSTFVLAEPEVITSTADVVNEEPVQIVKVPASNEQAIAELLFQFQNLQVELTSLRGEVESLRFELDQLRSESKDRYIDLDRRISDGRTTSFKTPAVQSNVNESQPDNSSVKSSDPEAIQNDYNIAKDLIRQKDYVGAIQAFNEFVSNYSVNEYTANAHYWMGEVYLVIPDVDNAIKSFSIVVDNFASHHKHPDALYRLGITLIKNGKSEQGQVYLEQLGQLYPDSQLVPRAQKILDTL